MKSFTDIEQSKKLAEILPLESADMYYHYHNVHYAHAYEDRPTVRIMPNHFSFFEDDLPCWSLAALLDVLELPTLEKNGIGKGKTGWMVTHYDVNGMRYDTTYYANAVDACYEMIIKLKERKLL